MYVCTFMSTCIVLTCIRSFCQVKIHTFKSKYIDYMYIICQNKIHTLYTYIYIYIYIYIYNLTCIRSFCQIEINVTRISECGDSCHRDSVCGKMAHFVFKCNKEDYLSLWEVSYPLPTQGDWACMSICAYECEYVWMYTPDTLTYMHTGTESVARELTTVGDIFTNDPRTRDKSALILAWSDHW
jgi:hypothetical protein